MITQDLGIATAYGYAKSKGYTGTEAEFAELMASYASTAQTAIEAADRAVEANTAAQSAKTDAAASKTAAQTAAQTATTVASEASQSASTATTKASEASTSADTASAAATSASTSAQTATTAAATATTKASEAGESATTATTAKTDAETARDAAAQSASEAAESARTLTIDATLTQSGQAADSKAVGESFNDVREIVVGDNLCDNGKLTTGYLDSNGSIDGSVTYYQTSDYIPVVVGQTYNMVAYLKKYGTIAKTRYTALLYDTNKNVISGSYVNVDNTNGISVTVSDENAKYLRACSHIDPSIHLFQVEAGSEPTYMKKYSRSVRNNMDLPQIEPLKELEGIAHKEIGANLLKQNDKEDGYIYNSSGIVAEADNYYTSDYIKVEGGKSYVFYNFSSNARMVGALYDSNKDCIPSTYVNNASTKSLTFTAQQDGYIRVSTTKAIFTSYAMLVEGDTAPQTYEPYNEFYRLPDNVVVPDASNILKEKKWCPCGDSFTASTNAKYDSGLYSGADKVYPRIIALRNDMNLVSTFFASGRTLAYPSSGDFTNSLTCPSAPCYYQNIPADTDYITIMLGINDSHHENGVGGDGEDPTGVIPLGTIDDADTSTYYGAWNVVLSWLMENRPNAHIGIIVSNGCDRVAYRTAQIEIATKYGVPYIDLNGDSRTPAMIRTQNPNIATAVKTILRNKQAIDPDGSQTGSVNTHPNWQAHEYESTFIEDFLRSI